MAARCRSGSCRLAPRAAAADNEHVGPAVLRVEATRAARMLVEPAEPCDVTEESLVHRPEAPRADHRAVVEADRRERSAKVVDRGQQVSLE